MSLNPLMHEWCEIAHSLRFTTDRACRRKHDGFDDASGAAPSWCSDALAALQRLESAVDCTSACPPEPRRVQHSGILAALNASSAPDARSRCMYHGLSPS